MDTNNYDEVDFSSFDVSVYVCVYAFVRVCVCVSVCGVPVCLSVCLYCVNVIRYPVQSVQVILKCATVIFKKASVLLLLTSLYCAFLDIKKITTDLISYFSWILPVYKFPPYCLSCRSIVPNKL